MATISNPSTIIPLPWFKYKLIKFSKFIKFILYSHKPFASKLPSLYFYRAAKTTGLSLNFLFLICLILLKANETPNTCSSNDKNEFKKKTSSSADSVLSNTTYSNIISILFWRLLQFNYSLGCIGVHLSFRLCKYCNNDLVNLQKKNIIHAAKLFLYNQRKIPKQERF